MNNNNNTLNKGFAMPSNTTNSLYTVEEEEFLAFNLEMRKKVINKLTDNGKAAPERQNDQRVLDLFITNADVSIHKKAENRTKHQAAQNNEEMLDVVAATIKSISMAHSKIDSRSTRQIELSIDAIPVDVVEGESSLGTTDFDIAEFTGDK